MEILVRLSHTHELKVDLPHLVSQRRAYLVAEMTEDPVGWLGEVEANRHATFGGERLV